MLAIGDDVESGVDLIVHGGDHGIVLDLAEVGAAEGIEVLAREFQPGEKRVAADDGTAKGTGMHGTAGNGEGNGKKKKRGSEGDGRAGRTAVASPR